MRLHQIQALIASADTGSIRAAARSLGISQAAVTRALRDLEQACQIALLVRGPNGLTFTESGMVMLQHARLIINQIQQAQNELAHLRGEAQGHLCLGVTPWVMMTFLPETIQEFRKRMPMIRLELYESFATIVYPLLRSGAMDLVIGHLPSVTEVQEFSCEPLLSCQTAVLTRRGHPRRDCGSIHDLLDQDWILNFTPAMRQSLLALLFGKFGANIEEERILNSHSLGMTMAMIEHTDTCAWGPAIFAQFPFFRDRFICLSLAEKFDPLELGIITRHGSTRSAAATCFVECLLQVIRRHSRSSKKEDRQIFDTVTFMN